MPARRGSSHARLIDNISSVTVPLTPCEFDVTVEGLYPRLVEIINSLQYIACPRCISLARLSLYASGLVCQPLSTFLQLNTM